MKIKGLIPFVDNVANWIIRLTYVNFLWVIFSILGLVIFGVFPSTIALFTVIRQWMKQGTDIPIWKTFKDAYKQNFIKINIVGLVYLLIGVVTYIDLRFFQTQSGLIYTALSYIFIVILSIYFIVGVFLIPVYVHYDFKNIQYLRQTVFIIFSKPANLILILIFVVITCLILFLIPGLILVCGVSLPALILMRGTYKVFTEI